MGSGFGLSIGVGIHFGRPYDPAYWHEMILALRPWVLPEFTAYRSGVPEAGATKSQFDAAQMGRSVANAFKVSLDSRSWRDFTRGRMPALADLRGRNPDRPWTLSSRIHADDTYTMELGIPLWVNEEENLESLWALFGTHGEDSLIGICDRMNPVWATFGTQEVYTPSIMEVATKTQILPTWVGFYGSWLVQRLDRGVLTTLMREFSRAEFLSSGGLYMRWGDGHWRSPNKRPSHDLNGLLTAALREFARVPPNLPPWVPVKGPSE